MSIATEELQKIHAELKDGIRIKDSYSGRVVCEWRVNMLSTHELWFGGKFKRKVMGSNLTEALINCPEFKNPIVLIASGVVYEWCGSSALELFRSKV